MPLRLDELAKTIDLTLPSAKASPKAVAKLCEQAGELHVASVCVLPQHVATAAELTHGGDVKVAVVIGFPLGSEPLKERVSAAECSVADGADEVEIVLNVKAMVEGDFRRARDELVTIARAARTKGANMKGAWPLVKVVVETSQLDEKRTHLACKIAEEAEADFVQTSSGFGPDGTTAFDVELLREWLPDQLAVKASGRIKTTADVFAMLNAGAGRVGTSAAAKLAASFTNDSL
ncbi:MAG: deoxyribose-phosphate aldolase [Gaiellales bacterium]